MKLPTTQEVIDLSGKTAIVTGGAMGIGLGIVRRLAQAGAKVVIADLDKKAGDSAVKEVLAGGGQAVFFQTNVANEKDIKKLVVFVVKKYEGIDILVNNAGIYPMVPMAQMDSTTFEKILSVNLKSVFFSTKAVSQAMIKKGTGGKIINITSIDALHPSSVGLAAYDASKHGLWGFTKNTALELAPYNISVNAIAPGGIATPGTGTGKPTSPAMKAILKQFLAKIPMRRMGDPDDIGKVALFLASDLSSYMTGTQIVVDGGVLLT
ncbi:MAG: SDR family NAD(P)-dependent oxidoreductase [bacterium]|nr:SDR family NAD(P)-dependent oxidoreductase [bacterium]